MRWKRTCEKGWSDYGMTKEEGRALKERCKTDRSEAFREKLYDAAFKAHPGGALVLIDSLMEGTSYYKQLMRGDIPWEKQQHFDGYKRKCIAELKKLLDEEKMRGLEEG